MSDDYGYGGGDQAEPEDLLTNIDAEAALLGAMLLDNDILQRWSDRLTIDDFAEPVHGRIFSALLRFSAKGMLASAVSLKPVFQMDAQAEHGEYLMRLVDSSVVTTGADQFAEQIMDLANRRVTRAALQAAQEALLNDFDTPIAEIAGRAESTAYAAGSRREATTSRSIADMIRLAGHRVERIQDAHESPGIENLFVPDLDKVLGLLEPGTYNLLAGRPGMGKTVLANSAALGYAANGHPVVFCSAEMTEEQLAMRATTDLAFALGHRIKHKSLKMGTLTIAERSALAGVAERAESLPLDYIDVRQSNIIRVWSEVARKKAMWAARGRQLKLVVIDYLGLFEATGNDGKAIEDDRKRMNAVSKFVLKMAQSLDVAVIALCQLSRAVESREDKRPRLSDLKETGNLEQDADSVSFVYREQVYLEQTEPKIGETDSKGKDLHEAWEVDMMAVRNKIDLIGAKNRHERTITRTANFYGEYFAVRAADVLDIGHEEPLLI